MSVYGYGNVGMGYRYPKRARKAVIAEPEKWARAAIYNKGVVAENPWVQHLKKKGVYDQIRLLLQEAKKDYVPKNPEKRRISLMREMENLRDEYATLATDYPNLRQNYPYKVLSYDDARQSVMTKLLNRIDAISRQLGIPPFQQPTKATQPKTPLYLSKISHSPRLCDISKGNCMILINVLTFVILVCYFFLYIYYLDFMVKASNTFHLECRN
jgi:hypothetical protein